MQHYEDNSNYSLHNLEYVKEMYKNSYPNNRINNIIPYSVADNQPYLIRPGATNAQLLYGWLNFGVGGGSYEIVNYRGQLVVMTQDQGSQSIFGLYYNIKPVTTYIFHGFLLDVELVFSPGQLPPGTTAYFTNGGNNLVVSPASPGVFSIDHVNNNSLATINVIFQLPVPVLSNGTFEGDYEIPPGLVIDSYSIIGFDYNVLAHYDASVNHVFDFTRIFFIFGRNYFSLDGLEFNSPNNGSNPGANQLPLIVSVGLHLLFDGYDGNNSNVVGMDQGDPLPYDQFVQVITLRLPYVVGTSVFGDAYTIPMGLDVDLITDTGTEWEILVRGIFDHDYYWDFVTIVVPPVLWTAMLEMSTVFFNTPSLGGSPGVRPLISQLYSGSFDGANGSTAGQIKFAEGELVTGIINLPYVFGFSTLFSSYVIPSGFAIINVTDTGTYYECEFEFTAPADNTIYNFEPNVITYVERQIIMTAYKNGDIQCRLSAAIPFELNWYNGMCYGYDTNQGTGAPGRTVNLYGGLLTLANGYNLLKPKSDDALAGDWSTNRASRVIHGFFEFFAPSGGASLSASFDAYTVNLSTLYVVSYLGVWYRFQVVFEHALTAARGYFHITQNPAIGGAKGTARIILKNVPVAFVTYTVFGDSSYMIPGTWEIQSVSFDGGSCPGGITLTPAIGSQFVVVDDGDYYIDAVCNP